MANSSRDYDWIGLVKEFEGEGYYEKPVTYEFSQKTFKEQPNSGVYHKDETPA